MKPERIKPGMDLSVRGAHIKVTAIDQYTMEYQELGGQETGSLPMWWIIENQDEIEPL